MKRHFSGAAAAAITFCASIFLASAVTELTLLFVVADLFVVLLRPSLAFAVSVICFGMAFAGRRGSTKSDLVYNSIMLGCGGVFLITSFWLFVSGIFSVVMSD